MTWTLHYHDGVEFWDYEKGTPEQITKRIEQLRSEGIEVHPMDPREWYGAGEGDWIVDY